MDAQPARISWTTDGARLVTCQRGTARIVGSDGAKIRAIPQPTVRVGSFGTPIIAERVELRDVRSLSDGRLIALDELGFSHVFTKLCELASRPPEVSARVPVSSAVLGDDGRASLVVHDGGVTLSDCVPEPRKREAFGNLWGTKNFDFARVSGALAHDRMHLVFGSDRWSKQGRTNLGYAWSLYDLTSYQPTPRTAIDGAAVGSAPSEHPLAFAFDRAARRIAIAHERGTGSATIRIGVEGHTATAAGVPATQVALDDRGIRAAYVVAGERRLQIDYLSPAATGSRLVEVIDSLSIDPGLEVVALAFSPDANQIALLGEDGRVEIVPVP